MCNQYLSLRRSVHITRSSYTQYGDNEWNDPCEFFRHRPQSRGISLLHVMCLPNCNTPHSVDSSDFRRVLKRITNCITLTRSRGCFQPVLEITLDDKKTFNIIVYAITSEALTVTLPFSNKGFGVVRSSSFSGVAGCSS